jgi:hypothetical protein
MTSPPLPTTLGERCEAPLRLGEPDAHGALAVYPVFGPAPRLDYVAFAQAQPAGVTIREREGAASVNDLVVVNPTDRNVLLYEGEEVLGAMQNRTFDVSVLVAAGAKLEVPVSCVEAGRWDGSRHEEGFAAAPQAAYPSLRRMKNAAAAVAGRADQSAVWQEVAAKSARHDVVSETGAMHDVFEQRRETIGALCSAIELHEGQCGALVSIAGRLEVLDLVSRPEVFAALHGPLVQGYALDALEVSGGQPAPSVEDAQAWLDQTVLGAATRERDGVGLGREVRFESAGATGAGLVEGDELVQLSAFAAAPADEPRARIRRPGRRRR